MTILAIETTGIVCGVCIMVDGKSVVTVETDVPNIHDVQLLRATKTALHDAALSFDEIDVVAVSSGPGSFTGTRIGVSFAKGLTMLNSPRLLGIATLDSLACAAANILWENDSFEVAAVIGSHRDHVFMQRFRIRGKDSWQAVSDIESDHISKVRDLIHEGDIIVGPATELTNSPVTLSAIHIASTAHLLIENGTARYADPLTFVPEYRQEFKGRQI